MQFEQFEVGKLYKTGITQYDEGPKFDFLQSGAVLNLYYIRPTAREIEDITAGRFELGFTEKDGIIFMLFRFGSGQHMDAPYSVHLSAPFTFETLQEGMGFGLSIFLVDASTGILRGMRYVGLSTDFSQRFKKSVERQKLLSFNKATHQKAIEQVYANYSTSDLVQRADSWCRIK